ncbi:MAG: flippase-like domain-containing protein [Elusimicrobia bacterium]|nr:flippase-like domain-containing protein [Elusimicrobiota bacterium]
MSGRFAKIFKILLPLAVSSAIICLLFRNIQPRLFIDHLISARMSLILPAVAVSLFFNNIFAAYRWHYILRATGCGISFRETLFLFMGSRPVRSIIPLKIGTLALPLYLKRNNGFPVIKSIYSIVLDKAYSSLGIFSCIYAGFVFFRIPVTVKILAALVLIAMIYFVSGPMAVIFRKALRFSRAEHYAPGDIAADISAAQKLVMFFSGIVFQASFILAAGLIFGSLDIDVIFPRLAVFIPLTVLITNIPVTVSGVGTREAAVMVFFAGIADTERLLSAGILISLLCYLLHTLISVFLLYGFTKKLLAGRDIPTRTENLSR